MIEHPFLGTIYTEDYDEQVRPQRHAPHLRPFTGSYEVPVEASELMFAPSKKAARAAMLDRLTICRGRLPTPLSSRGARSAPWRSSWIASSLRSLAMT